MVVCMTEERTPVQIGNNDTPPSLKFMPQQVRPRLLGTGVGKRPEGAEKALLTDNRRFLSFHHHTSLTPHIRCILYDTTLPWGG